MRITEAVGRAFRGKPPWRTGSERRLVEQGRREVERLVAEGKTDEAEHLASLVRQLEDRHD